MPTFTLYESTPISMAELKEQLSQIKQRDGELNFRGQKTEEYLQYFVSYKPAVFKKVKESLEGLSIPRLKTEHFVKLLDALPTTPTEVKITLQGFNVSVSNENCKKISDAVKSILDNEKPIETAEPPKAPTLPEKTEKPEVKKSEKSESSSDSEKKVKSKSEESEDDKSEDKESEELEETDASKE